MAANHQWALGDLAIKVSALKVRGERTLERYAERIGVEYSTLQVYHAVAQKWPENLPRGRFSVCRELMTHPDRAALITADPQMRVEEARELMRVFKGGVVVDFAPSALARVSVARQHPCYPPHLSHP